MKCAVWCWLSSDSNWCKTRFCHLLVVWLFRGFIAWTVYKLLCLPQDLQLCPLRRVRKQIRFPPSEKTRDINSFVIHFDCQKYSLPTRASWWRRKTFFHSTRSFPNWWNCKDGNAENFQKKLKFLIKEIFKNFTSDPQSFDQRT